VTKFYFSNELSNTLVSNVMNAIMVARTEITQKK